MKNLMKEKDFVHYNHTDPCSHARWTARECYQFMYQRPWKPVADFYFDLLNGNLSLSSLFRAERPLFIEKPSEDDHEVVHTSEECKLNSKDRTGRWKRATFKIVLSYHGASFDGWQKQPGLNTVQGLVEKSLGAFIDDRKLKQLQEKSLPIEGCALVAGRTDKGVTALNQVCSFYTWREDVKNEEIKEAINRAAPGNVRVISVSKVSREFHPNFSAKWRRYFYIFPVSNGEEVQNNDEGTKSDIFGSCKENNEVKQQFDGEIVEGNSFSYVHDEGYDTGRTKPRSFDVSRVNQLLQQLEGKTLSYKMFARDTKASRSMGPPTECFVYHARAAEAMLPSNKGHFSSHVSQAEVEVIVPQTRVMCVELIANRFLRKMVRVLVATSIREAAAGAEDDALLKLMEATCRRATAPPAPPEGLCLFDVGYGEFSPEICLIP
ncbi:hypothetical protein H6P81_009734 [Aristolochia fimbriata]|uniref:tRNA pseudouridine synthase n=1 Tax=Aristolochia fimbriata TaxID=158543 RepID=A0AAV7EMX1_ARIFI|nr:hypothetical protein H6P81_009734 [Aristolochia fimbriata]